jgi:hypothetical protein
MDEPILRIDREVSLTGWMALRPYRADYLQYAAFTGAAACGFVFVAFKFNDPAFGIIAGMLLAVTIWYGIAIAKTLKRYRTPILLHRSLTPDGFETSVSGMESKIMWNQIKPRSQTRKAVVFEIRASRQRIQLEKSDFSEAELAAILHWHDAANPGVASAVLFK